MFDFQSVRKSDPVEQLKAVFEKHQKCTNQRERLQKVAEVTNQIIDKTLANYSSTKFENEIEKTAAESKAYKSVRTNMDYLVAVENALALASIAEVLYEIKHDLYNRS